MTPELLQERNEAVPDRPGEVPPVVPLSSVGTQDLAIAGGKGANLGELIAAGFAVPPGFVVTAHSYLRAMTDAGILTAGTGPTGIADPAALRRTIETAPVPIEIADAIRSAYRELGEGAVAVRSSATAEDLPGAAFAGQQDTHLNVLGAESVVHAVRLCWASLWTDRAIAYRERQGEENSALRMAVVVQRMVEAEWAGVMFTADPVTGDRTSTVIDANPGLGEAVVSGRVTPDHVVVDSRGRVREHRIGRREVMIRPRAEGGTREDLGAIGAPFPLPDTIAVGLRGIGSRIQSRFGRPMDVEWAYSESGRGTQVQGADGLWILQARSITALPPAPLRIGRLRRIMGAVLAELLPVRPYPLDMSTWVVHGHGRILARMLAEIPALKIDVRDLLPEVDGVVDQLVPAKLRPTLRTATTPLRMARGAARFPLENWRSDRRFLDFDNSIAELRATDVAPLPWSELLRLPRTAFGLLDRFIDLRVDYLPRVGVDLLRLRIVLALLGANRFFTPLTLGAHTRTADATAALRKMAECIRVTPQWRTAFDTLDDERLRLVLESNEEFVPLRARVAAFLAEYGHRETTSAFLMSQPTWSDDPSILFATLRSMAAEPSPVRDPSASARTAEQEISALRRVRLTRSGPLVARLAGAARAGLAFREDTHFHAIRPLPVLRRALLEAGKRLASAGVLDRESDVLHLRLEEIESIRGPESIPAEHAERLRSVVRQRSKRRAELAGSPLISPATLFPSHRDDASTLVRGTPTGSGKATGPVRVLRDPSQFGRLQSGDILVCPYTNPSWTPLFEVAAAVVVDSGGLASHAAIVAREYGIPAIMGTGTGTSLLRDGMVVTVDGGSGRVTAADGTP